MATKYRTCHLCEATCGLTLEVEGNRVVSAKGDPDDSFSRGYLCPKGAAIGKLHEDPDKLKQPMKRKPDGTFEPIGWDEAYRLAGEGLSAVVRKHGRHALAHYIGNPVVHHVGALYGSEQWREVSGSRNRYTANSQDVNPHLVANTTMFGMQFAQPVPDLSRSKLLVIMGANPLASNGSLMTAPGMGRRLRDIQKRGGRVLVIDPRRSETAAIADEHWPIRPGTDALLLLAIAQTLLAEGLTDTEYLARYTRGTGGLGGLLEPFAPEHVVVRLGGKITADAIKALARDLAARKGYVYGRLGMCLSPFAGLTCWGLKLVNLLTGSIDREGGALFAEGLASHLFDLSFGRGSYDRYRSPQGAPEVNAEYPCHILADQIERGLADPKAPEAVFGMVTICGNPVLSAPNGPRIAAAFTKLEFMVSVDIYLSETARLADLVLPPRSSLYDPQFDPVFQQVAVESYARWSEPVFDAKEHGVTQPSEFELLTRLTHEVFSRAPRAGFKGKRKGFRAWLGTKLSVEGISDLLIRTGPRGDRFLPFSEGLNLKKLRKAEHGLPTEPLRAGRLASKIKHPDGRIDLAPAVYRADLPRLLKELEASKESDGSLVLIGRRHLKTNNSWFHNVPGMAGAKNRCTLLMHPRDAKKRGVASGDRARVTSRVGSLEAEVEVTESMLEGVVSLPHGWGHEHHAGAIAREHAGVSVNDVTDGQLHCPITGNAGLNGVPVAVERAVGDTPAPSVALASVAS